jgi:replicative DNA helicase
MGELTGRAYHAQRLFLGAVLSRPGVLADALDSGFQPELAFGDHAIILGAARVLSDAGRALDAFAVAEGAGMSVETVRSAADRPPPHADAGEYARVIMEESLWRLREDRLIRLGEALALRDESRYDMVLAERVEDAAANDVLSVEALRDDLTDYLNPDVDQKVWPLPWDELTRALFGGLRPGDTTVLAGWSSFGKALHVDTPILTLDGWKTMGDLTVSDQVFQPNGAPTRVIQAHAIQHGRPCYEVKFSDGSNIIADEDHLWVVDTCASRRSRQGQEERTEPRIGNDQRHLLAQPLTVSTRELGDLIGTETRGRPSIPLCEPVEFPVARLPIDPYALGVWLGDGASLTAGVGMMWEDAEIVVERIRAGGEYVAPLRAGRTLAGTLMGSFTIGSREPCELGHKGRRTGTVSQYPSHHRDPCPSCMERTLRHAPFKECGSARLRDLGLIQNKHIPREYMHASVEQRRALLAGLSDTDGCCGSHVDFTFASKRLRDDVAELAQSLGFRVTFSERKVWTDQRTAYRLGFGLSGGVEVAHLPRKRNAGPGWKARARYVTAVTPVASVPVRCITVDADDGMFLAGRSLIATHNSLAAVQVIEFLATKGARGCFYTNEMTARELIVRLAATKSHVSHRAIMERRLSSDQRVRVLAAADSLAFPIGAAFGWAAEDVARSMRKNKWDICVLDLFNRLPNRGTVQDVDRAITVLCDAAAVTGTHLIVVSQLNQSRVKDGIRPFPTGRDLRESGSLLTHPANCLFVHREQKEVDGRIELQEEGVIYIEKARNGVRDVKTNVFLNSITMTFDRNELI